MELTSRPPIGSLSQASSQRRQWCVSPGEWDNNARGVHFGTANLAAFFAEDRIEALDDSSIGLAIFGAPLEMLSQCGPLAADGQMVDCPVYTRIDAGHDADALWEKSSQDWQSSLTTLGSVVVLGHVPAALLVQFRTVDDLRAVLPDNFSLKPNQRARSMGPN